MIPQAQDQSNPVIEVASPRARYLLASDRDPSLASALAAAVESGAAEVWPGFEEVKSSTVRQTLRGHLDGLAVHVKLFRAVRLSDRARDAITGSRAIAEFYNLLEAVNRGLPCVVPVAAGSTFGSFGARSFLVSETADGTPLARGPLPPDVAHSAGALLRRAHDAGLHARDLHPGNMLLRTDGSLLLLDLTSATWAQPLELDQRAHALSFFCLDLDGGVAHPAAAPLLRGYGCSAECANRALRRGLRLRNRALSAFGRRATRACRHTTVEAGDGTERWYWHAPAAPWHDAARAMAAAPPPPLVQGRRGAVHLTDDLVMKVRQTARARALFRATYWLEFAAIPCAPPVAMHCARGRGEVFYRRLPGPNLAEEVAAGLPPPAVWRAAERLGNAVGRLHGFGLRNRDLKFENLIRDPETGEVAMIDLDGVHRKIACDSRGQGADVGRVWAAFRAAGEPGGGATLTAFLRGYTRARKRLRQPTDLHRLVRLARARAAAWSSAHPASPA